MEKSPKTYSQELSEVLREVLWRQWTALGVAAHGTTEGRYVLDVEALLAATLSAAQLDERLLRSALEWITGNTQLVNRSRLQRIGKAWSDAGRESKVELFSLETSAGVNEFLSSTDQQALKFLPTTSAQPRGMAHAPRWSDSISVTKRIRPGGGPWPAWGQLRLRELFGLNSRPEILLHLLTIGGGSSLGIARRMGHDQKAVYRTLEAWTSGGVVRKGSRNEGYALTRPEWWQPLLGFEGALVFPDWTTALLSICLAVHGLAGVPRSDDHYLAASFLRDLLPPIAPTARLLGIPPPDVSEARGAAALIPAYLGILELAQRLAGNG